MSEPLRNFRELKETWDAARKTESRRCYEFLRVNRNVATIDANDTEIASIIVSHPLEQGSHSINLTVKLQEADGRKPLLLNFHLFEDGTLSPEDKRNRDLGDKLAIVLAYHLSDGEAGFWEESNLRLFAKASGQGEEKNGKGGSGKKKNGIDLARLENLREISCHEGALFGFLLKDRKGFPGYVCVVFPDCILLENISFNHRIYLREGIPPIDLRDCNPHHPHPGKRVPQEKRQAIIASLASYLPQEISKQEFRELPGVTTVRHFGEWQEDLRAQLRKLMGSGEKGRAA